MGDLIKKPASKFYRLWRKPGKQFNQRLQCFLVRPNQPSTPLLQIDIKLRQKRALNN